MTARLEFYGQLGDVMGRERKIALPAEAYRIEDIVRRLAHEHDEFRDAMSVRMRVALNDRIVEPAALVRDGDVVAFLPPFSGG